MIRTALLVSALALAVSACASTAPTETAAQPSAPVASTAGPAPTTTLMNAAATSSWRSQTRLPPQQPILALIADGGSVDNPIGLSFSCNPDNGAIVGRLAGQSSARVGQEATFQLKLGALADGEELDGRFELKRGGTTADFVFPFDGVKLRTLAQLDQATFLTDQGGAQWAFVANPATKVPATNIGSLKNLKAETDAFMIACNPK